MSDEHFAIFYCVSPSSGCGWASQGHSSFLRQKEGLGMPVTLPGNLLRIFLYLLNVIIYCVYKSQKPDFDSNKVPNGSQHLLPPEHQALT